MRIYIKFYHELKCVANQVVISAVGVEAWSNALARLIDHYCLAASDHSFADEKIVFIGGELFIITLHPDLPKGVLMRRIPRALWDWYDGVGQPNGEDITVYRKKRKERNRRKGGALLASMMAMSESARTIPKRRIKKR